MKYPPFILLLLIGFLTSCTTSGYKRRADESVTKLIQTVEQEVFGESSEFNINTAYSDRSPDEISSEEILQDREQRHELNLSILEALKYASKHSRDYQTEKESLYLTALALTGERHEFHPSFFGNSTYTRQKDADGNTTDLEEHNLGVGQLLATGANISAQIASDILTFVVGDGSRSASSVLSFSITQPLLRGFGRDNAAEQLTQAQRDVIYAVRDFGYFQDEFTVDIVIRYFRLLQQKDTVFNEYSNYQSRKVSTDYLRARAVDREKQLDVNQAEQAELSAKNRYIDAIANYKNAVNSFKLTLGVPLTVDLRLVDDELVKLREKGLIVSELNRDNAYSIALENRLPLLNEIDRFEDSKRKVSVAANRLRPDLSIFANGSVDSEADNDYLNFDFDNIRRNVGIQLRLPFDRLHERNSYRATLIRFESELRSLGKTFDDLRNTLDRGIREVERLRQNYMIQVSAVELAEKRVAGARLLLESGKAIFRDLEQAQDSLISAQNAQTAALVNYLNARLNLLVNLGILDAGTGSDSFWLQSASSVDLSFPEDDSSDSFTHSSFESSQENNRENEVITPSEVFGE